MFIEKYTLLSYNVYVAIILIIYEVRFMCKTIKVGDREIISVDENEKMSMLSANDIEMDKRAKEAVKAAINRAKVCGKPVARYDVEQKRVYIETADGVKKYV